MKTSKIISLVIVCVALLASCSKSADTYQAGFSTLELKNSYRYANNTSDTLVLLSMGRWAISNAGNNDWCALSTSRGSGGMTYHIGVNFSENTTGKAREALYIIKDVDYPTEAYAQWRVTQLATRGDGALGNARMVSKVTGSDNSIMEVTYDASRRPLTFVMSKNDTELYNMKFSYDDPSGVMKVRNGYGMEMTATYGNDYQPQGQIASQTDTVKFVEQGYVNSLSSSYAFNVERHYQNGSFDGYSYKMDNYRTLAPDLTHNAAEMRYASGSRGASTDVVNLRPSYSDKDNRCQSLDVNQLLLGVERCNPYMLLSFFRFARNSNIFSTVQTDDGDILVEAVLNADKSVSTLSVTRGGETITYTFEYAY